MFYKTVNIFHEVFPYFEYKSVGDMGRNAIRIIANDGNEYIFTATDKYTWQIETYSMWASKQIKELGEDLMTRKENDNE